MAGRLLFISDTMNPVITRGARPPAWTSWYGAAEATRSFGRSCDAQPDLLAMNLMQTILTVRTPGAGLHEFTSDVAHFVRESGAQQGLLTLFVQHTSCSLLIQENADPDVRRDLDEFFGLNSRRTRGRPIDALGSARRRRHR